MIKTRKDQLKLLLFNILTIAFLLSAWNFYHAWTNTLSRKPHWESSKVALEKGVMGSWSFILTHRALAHEHLDLGTWHGFQEVYLKESPVYDSLSLDIKLSPQSHLVICFGERGDTLHGIRLSLDKLLPSAWVKVSNQAFIEKTLTHLPIEADQWLSLSLHQQDNELTLYIDNHPIYHIPNHHGMNHLMLRGSMHPTQVDHIQLFSQGGKLLFEEDFDRERRHGGNVILLLIVGNVLFMVIPWIRRFALISMGQIAAISLGLSLYFSLLGQEQYPRGWMIHWGKQTSTIEAADTLSDHIRQSYETRLHPGSYRIMFIGSSQTWGAGANQKGNTFVSLIEKHLQDKHQALDIQCINAGISGVNSSDLLRYYQEKWIDLKPNLLMVNLGFNDGDSPDFEPNLKAFIDLNKSGGIETIFVLEPVLLEGRAYLENHYIMQEVAETHGLLCVDMQGYISDRLDQGFLFWDFIHLTNYGQQLFAEELIKYLLPYLPDWDQDTRSKGEGLTRSQYE